MAYETEPSIVEATSLSTIQHIATNPPAHPKAPTDVPRLPLVLYIARVPGSRDVFLTPIKPREKVVTAEDVQSSLYFIHVHDAADDEEPGHRPSPVQPNPPPYPLDDGPPNVSLLPLAPPKHGRLGRVLRKPVASGTSSAHITPTDLPVLPRRPLPTPPQDEQPLEQSLHAHNKNLLRRAEHSDENNPYLREYEPLPPPIDSAHLPEPGSLTLIRRNPASSEQWNVASIHDPPVQEISSAALRNPTAAQRTKRGGAPLYLDISNPGYTQFIQHERTQSRQSSDTTSSNSSDPPPDGVFRRRLYMPGSQYGEHLYNKSRRSSSVTTFSAPMDEASMRHSMRYSVDMGSSTSSAPYADRRSKGYTFNSPWDGRCEFSTGATGKSLRCKHYPPRTPGQSIEVSELRFNLPTSSSKAANAPLTDKRSSYMSGLHRRLHSSSEDGSVDFVFDDDGNLDLTLGREKAGGGFGGKQAKLGKLIIQPEGLAMLDLLVAANVGLWWRAWGR
ncbi:uncharacterized protein MYCFIDRAFT_25608 [Pseudocercospora fijiensis CIRAD86]|uniref:Uncharacterized protein n=1 Tax=Pseudocercospora fijiensis (strain CIRAD86) TaxID=383855 RepID=M3AUD4_PSEFD|nr:uncharacterized protein MYCFIDRAFT_25608 [Pseudocercospora fijiensis CIRAD86]EME81092.1 hypothetical protein MYCFIDRAFT_25608 [Pseudocercospora fijiensis CIRAD86]